MFDICFCNEDCDSDDPAKAGNWFKVGQLRFASYQLVSAAYATASSPAVRAVQYIKQGGIIGFRRIGEDDYDVMGLAEGGVLKIIPDEAKDNW